MLGRSKFSQKQLHKKSCSDIQEMLFDKHKINWNNLETSKKRGTAVLSAPYNGIDKETPIFSQDRDYIQNIVDCKGSEND